MIRAVILIISLILLGVFAYYFQWQLNKIALPSDRLFSNLYSGELQLNDAKFQSAVSCSNKSYSDLCGESKQKQQPQQYPEGFYWQNNATHHSMVLAATGLINRQAVTNTSGIACSNNMYHKIDSFEGVYGKDLDQLKAIFTVAEPDRPRLHVKENTHIVVQDKPRATFKLNPTKMHEDIVRMVFEGVVDKGKRYNYAILFGKLHKDGGLPGYKFVDDDGRPRSLLEGADYYFLLASMDAAVSNQLSQRAEPKKLSYLGETVIEVKLAYRSSGCSMTVNSLTLESHDLPAAEQEQIEKSEPPPKSVVLIGQNHGRVVVEQYATQTDKLIFAPSSIKPEELVVFNDALKVGAIEPATQISPSVIRLPKLNVQPPELVECGTAASLCLVSEQQLEKVMSRWQRNALYYKGAGKAVRTEVDLINQRLVNSGVFITEAPLKSNDHFLQGERLSQNEILVESCHDRDCQLVPLVKVAVKNEPQLLAAQTLPKSNYFRAVFDQQKKAPDLVKYYFSRLPTELDDVYLLGSKKGGYLYLDDGGRQAPRCFNIMTVGDSFTSQDDAAVFSLVNSLQRCQLDRGLRENQQIVFVLKPQYCPEPNNCSLYRHPHDLAIQWRGEKQKVPSWKVKPPKLIKPKRKAKTAGEPKTKIEKINVPPDITVWETAKKKDSVKVFDSFRGLTDEGRALGLTSLVGFDQHYINHLGANSSQPKWQLSIEHDKQTLVYKTIKRQISTWLKAKPKKVGEPLPFKHYFGNSNRRGTASLSVVLLDVRSGAIIAAADSNAQFLENMKPTRRMLENEKLRPEKSPMRWLNGYHNAAFYDAPGSVFKLFTSVSLLQFGQYVQQLCDSKYQEQESRKNCKKMAGSVFSQYLVGENKDSELYSKGPYSNFFYHIGQCHYPYNELGGKLKPSYSKDNAAARSIYGKTIHNFESHRVYKGKNTECKEQRYEGRFGLAENILLSNNTWFAWMHEMITPALLYTGEGVPTEHSGDGLSFGQLLNKPRQEQGEKPHTNGLLGLSAQKSILHQIIPAANTVQSLGFNVPIDLLTGQPILAWNGTVHSPKSWILSPVNIKFDDIKDRQALRRFAIGVGHVAIAPVHAAALSASVAQGRVIYPRVTAEIANEVDQEGAAVSENDSSEAEFSRDKALTAGDLNIGTVGVSGDMLASLNLSPIISGMYKAVNNGWGTSYTTMKNTIFDNLCNKQKCVCLYAKTGTSPLDSGDILSQNSWITGWFFINSKKPDSNSYEGCPTSNAANFADKNAVAFGCAAKRVDMATTGSKGCGKVVAEIIKAGYEEGIWQGM